METIKATYTASMTKTWFLEFLHMLARCNPDQLIQITNTGMNLEAQTGTDRISYTFTGTFGTIQKVTSDVWLKELNKHIFDVQQKG